MANMNHTRRMLGVTGAVALTGIILILAVLLVNANVAIAKVQGDNEILASHLASKEHQIQLLQEQIEALRQEALTAEAELYRTQTEAEKAQELTEEREIQLQAMHETKWPEIEVPWNSIENCTVTAYCNCAKCCGKWAGGRTASGAWPIQGVTVAVDPSKIPLGAQVRFEGDDTIYVAQDTGVAGNWIDKYYDSHADAETWGLRYLKVYWRAV